MIFLMISFAYLSSYFLNHTTGVRRNDDEILISILMEISSGFFSILVILLDTKVIKILDP